MRVKYVAEVLWTGRVNVYDGGFVVDTIEDANLMLVNFQPDAGRNLGGDKVNTMKRLLKNEIKSMLVENYNYGVNVDVKPYSEEFDNESDGAARIDGRPITNINQAQGEFDINVYVTYSRGNRDFAEQLVFRSGMKDLWRKGVMFENSEDCKDGCAYEYITKTFGKRKGAKKLAKNKGAIQNAIKMKDHKDRARLEEFKKMYYDDFHNKRWEGELPQAVVEHEDEDWIKFHYDDLSVIKYTDEELKRGMSLLDLVRWCIVAKVSLNILSGDAYPMMNYQPTDFGDPSAIANISVVVENDHAYFIQDSNIKKSISKRVSIHSSIQELTQTKSVKKKTKPTILTIDDGEGEEEPTIDEIAELKDTIYYTNYSQLNDLVGELYDEKQLKPIYCSGSLTTIKQATYDEGLVITTWDKKPNWLDVLDYDDTDVKMLMNKYPKLEGWGGTIPTFAEIGKAIFKSSMLPANQQIESNLNNWLGKVFYEGEIKPELRTFHNDDWCEGWNNDWLVRSFDINTAYTNILKKEKMNKTDECFDFCKFDGMCEPKKYKGRFNRNWFYLCENLKFDFPNRGGKGNILYHGSMLELMMDRVEIKYEIRPSGYLTHYHFRNFIQAVEEVEEESQNIQVKKIVNCWIGTLKKKQGIVGYSQFIDGSDENARNYFYQGDVIRPLRKTMDGDTIRMMSRPNYRKTLSTGQPIRLCIIDQVNRILYKMMKMCKFSLLGFKTDAMYVLCNPEIENNFVEEFNSQSEYSIKTEHELLLEDYRKTPARENLTTASIPYVSNKWVDDIQINTKWSFNQGRMLLRLMLNNGGAWFNGKGGRGKTELIKLMKETTKRNKIRLKWWRLIWLSRKETNIFKLEQEFMKTNPCSYRICALSNKACVNASSDAKTFNKELGIKVVQPDLEDDEGEETITDGENYMRKIVDIYKGSYKDKQHSLNVFIAEEISMIDAYKYDVMNLIKNECPNLIFMLCGDIKHQLKPVGETRNFENTYLIKSLANFMKITLNYNFRENSATDTIETEVLDFEAFQNQYTNTKLTKRNISYTHRTRQRVIDLVQDSLVNPDVFKPKFNKKDKLSHRGHNEYLKCEFGTPLLVRQGWIHENNEGEKTKFMKNEMWAYGWKNNDNVIVYKSKTSVTITIDELIKYFLSGYCITGHACQGDTYDDEYTIHDWTKPQVDRRWRYVVVSRSTDYKNNVSIKKS